MTIKKCVNQLFGGLGKNMVLSAIYKPISMVLSFAYTPLLLQYLGDESYGVWITITSITAWINYFDIGIGNGMRNALASEVLKGNYEKARKIVSTSYLIITFIAVGAMIFSTGAVTLLNTDSLLNTSIATKSPIIVTIMFVCLNFVLTLCKSEMFAEQKAEKIGLMNILVNCLNLVGILIIVAMFPSNLLMIAILSGMSTSLVNLLFSAVLWRKKKYYKPSLKLIDLSCAKEIGSLGVKFFILQIGCLVLYSTDNLIIAHLFDPASVTPYNTVYKVFNVILVMFTAFISPVWSRITIEANRKNYLWIKSMAVKLNLLMIPIGLSIALLAIFFRDISFWWLGRNLLYEKGLIVCMGVFFALNIYSSIYSSILNGMSELNVQLYVSVFISLLNIPLSIMLATTCHLGVTGVILATIICMGISTSTLVIQTVFVLMKRIRKNV